VAGTTPIKDIIARSMKQSGYRIYLQKTRQPANSPRYYQLALEDTLTNALANREVIEFPTLYVSSAENLLSVVVINSEPTHLPEEL